MKEVYIGMDVHSKFIYCVVQDKNGKIVMDGGIDTNTEAIKAFLMEILKAPAGTQIGLESGQQAVWLSKYLSSLGMSPLVIDAKEVRAKARRVGQKSDKRDAFEICDGIRRKIYDSVVYVADEKTQRLKNILMRRRHFVNMCTREKNAAKFLLRANGIKTDKLLLGSEKGWEKLYERIGQKYYVAHAQMHGELWKLSNKQVKILEQELEAALEPFKDIMAVLTSAPCVGPLTAATYIAVIGNPDRFPDSSKVVSYTGLATATFNSGDSKRHGRITKRGSSELRFMLCEAAHAARNPYNPLNPYFAKVCAKKGYKRAIVAVAHRLSRILYQLWKRKEFFDIDKTNLEYGEYIKVRKTHYRLKSSKVRAG